MSKRLVRGTVAEGLAKLLRDTDAYTYACREWGSREWPLRRKKCIDQVKDYGVKGRWIGEPDGWSAHIFKCLLHNPDIVRHIMEYLAPSTITLFVLCVSKEIKEQLAGRTHWDMLLPKVCGPMLIPVRVPFAAVFARNVRRQPRMLTIQRYCSDARRLLERHYCAHFDGDESLTYEAGDVPLIPACDCAPGKPCAERLSMLPTLAKRNVRFVTMQGITPVAAHKAMIAQFKEYYEGIVGADGQYSSYRYRAQIDVASEWARSGRKAPVDVAANKDGDGYSVTGEQYAYVYEAPKGKGRPHDFVVCKGMRLLICGWKTSTAGSGDKHMFVQPIWRQVTVTRYRQPFQGDVVMGDAGEYPLANEDDATMWTAPRTTAEMSRICWTLNGTRYGNRASRLRFRKRLFYCDWTEN